MASAELSIGAIIAGGIAGCLAMDIWQRLLYLSTGNPPSNWAIVGRWFTYALRRFNPIQADIENKPSLSFELALGWAVHYAVGCGYAVIYLVMMQVGWLGISFIDGVIFGALSVVVPWFFFLPAMGKGMMGRLTPVPAKTCLLAFLTHVIFGVGIVLGLAII